MDASRPKLEEGTFRVIGIVRKVPILPPSRCCGRESKTALLCCDILTLQPVDFHQEKQSTHAPTGTVAVVRSHHTRYSHHRLCAKRIPDCARSSCSPLHNQRSPAVEVGVLRPRLLPQGRLDRAAGAIPPKQALDLDSLVLFHTHFMNEVPMAL